MAVIARLNPIIRGWAAYYRGVVSSKVFSAPGPSHVEAHLQVGHMAAHPNKPKRWIVDRYFGKFNKFRNDRWVFGDRDSGAYLVKFSWTRHRPARHGQGRGISR